MGQWCTKDDSAPKNAKKDRYQQDDSAAAAGTEASPILSQNSNRAKDFKGFKSLFGDEAALCIIPIGRPTQYSFICGGEDRKLHLGRWDNGRDHVSWKAHTNDINKLDYDATSHVVYSCSRDKNIKSWKLVDFDAPNSASDVAAQGGPTCGVFEGHVLPVTGISLSPDGNRLASGSRDNTTRLWDTSRCELLATQDVKLNIVHWVQWIDEFGVVAQGGEDLTVRLWDFRSQGAGDYLSLEATLANFDYHPICVSRHATKPEILYTGHNGFNGQGAMVTEWDLRQRKQVQHFSGTHTNTVRRVLHSTTLAGYDGRSVVLSASDDESICVWDTEKGSLLQQYHVSEGRVSCMMEDPVEHNVLLSLRSGGVMVGRFEDPLKAGDASPRLQRLRYFGDW